MPKLYYLAVILLCFLSALELKAHPIQSTESGSVFNEKLFYKPPQRGFSTRRISASTRGRCSAVPQLPANFKLQVLAPANHVGGTQTATPTMYWWVSHPVQANFRLTIAQIDENTLSEKNLILLNTQFPLQAKAGLQRFSLAQYNIQLAPNVAYDWSISLLCRPDMPSANITSIGGIFYQKHIHSATKAGIQTIRFDAKKGFWYDALDKLNHLSQQPSKAMHHWQHQRDTLLRQEGLAGVAKTLHPVK